MKNYHQANEILHEIQKAQHIIINIHRNPDLDSVGSATAMCEVLKKMGKKVTLICPHKVDKKFLFLKHTEKVKTIDYQSFEFSDYDLLLLVDTASWVVASDKRDLSFIQKNKIPIIVIDNHEENAIIEAQIRLIDIASNAAGEILYYLLKQWNIEITKDIATALYSTIMGDTVFLRYTHDTSRLYKLLATLIDYGADAELILKYYYNYPSLQYVKLIGRFLQNLQLSPSGTFVFTAVDYQTYSEHGKPAGIREAVADEYVGNIVGARFGVVVLEESPDKLMLSFRSTNDDVFKIAKLFNGGGHKHAAGAVIYGKFDKVLKELIRKLNIYKLPTT